MEGSRVRRWSVRLFRLCVLVGLAALAWPMLTLLVDAEHVSASRVQGETRYHTAANLALRGFERADVAHLVTADDFPDALAGSFAAGRADGPLLLVGADHVPAPTWEALEQLEVTNVVLIGGPAVVSEAVAEAVAGRGYQIERLAGSNRYATASAVALRYGADGQVGVLDGQAAALLVSGDDFPDALAAGPLAGGAGLPLLLTPPDRTEGSVSAALEQLGVERIVIVGGRAAVSVAVEEDYRAQGYGVERVAGGNRVDTARMVADLARERLGWSVELTVLARADDYPDALAGSAYAGRSAAPVLLAAGPARLGEETRAWYAGACPQVQSVLAVGGTRAIGPGVMDEALEAAAACHADTDGDS